MPLTRIGLVLAFVLLSASCRQMPDASGTDPYVGDYTPFAYAPSFVRITKDQELLMQNVYAGSNPWAPPQGDPASLIRHSATQFSDDGTRLEFGDPEHGRFQSLRVSMGQVFEKVEDAAPRVRVTSELEKYAGVYRARSTAQRSVDSASIVVRSDRLLIQRGAQGAFIPMEQLTDGMYSIGEGAMRLAFMSSGSTIEGFHLHPPPEQERRFVRVEKAIDEYLRPAAQEIYVEGMLEELAAGRYTFSRFISPSRGPVDFAVYLPPDWRKDGADSYPLLFFLHGQDGSEHAFRYGVPEGQLNAWIRRKLVPPFVLISLRAGRPAGREEQWVSVRNETLLTSLAPDEIRAFSQRYFRAGLTPRTTSIHGHSRGALGALHFALKYPRLFGSAVSNALVSDYAFAQEAVNARLNSANIIDSGILYRISIGDSDQFGKELGRSMAADTHALLDHLGIEHEYEVLAGVTHDQREMWNHRRDDNAPNGLYELRFHARAWQKPESAGER